MVYNSDVFIGGRALCTQILPRRGRPPSVIVGIRKLIHWATRRRSPHSCAFHYFDTIPECGGQTDRQTDGQVCRSIYSSCAFRQAVITNNPRLLLYVLPVLLLFVTSVSFFILIFSSLISCVNCSTINNFKSKIRVELEPE